MSLSWTKPMLLLALLGLGGCATDPEKVLPHGDATMLDIWNLQTTASSNASSRRLLDARQTLRRPVQSPMRVIDQTGYTRTAQTEIYRQFQRLSNPDLVMYVFPHLTGSEAVPVPGYSTVFPLYQRMHYALPGERVEDY